MKDILGKLLVCLLGILIFMAIIGSCEHKTYKENKKREARLNYEMYFNAVAESCMENSDFYNKLSRNMKEGHKHNCPACNFAIVSQYLHNENWDDTVGELPEYDNIDSMIVGYLDLMKDDIIECNHNYSDNTSE
jgi:hypothetical protein